MYENTPVLLPTFFVHHGIKKEVGNKKYESRKSGSSYFLPPTSYFVFRNLLQPHILNNRLYTCIQLAMNLDGIKFSSAF